MLVVTELGNIFIKSTYSLLNFLTLEHSALLPISNKENSHVMLVLNKNLHAMVKTEVLTLARSVNLLFPPITNSDQRNK